MSTSEVILDPGIKACNAISTTPVPEEALITYKQPVELLALVKGCMTPNVSENRQDCIAREAYFNAERRGFAPGHALDDWLAAENEVNPRLAGEGYVF